MELRSLINKVEQYFANSSSEDARATSALATPMDGLVLLRNTEPTGIEASVYEPIICLILQGEKETTVADETITIASGQCVLVSHDLPVTARITKASRQTPYLALVIRLDLAVLRSFYDEVGDAGFEVEGARALETSLVDDRVGSAIARYVDLIDDPVDARIIAPLVRKELHYRLLMSDSGAMLRSLLRRDSNASRVSVAIQTLRESYRDTLEVAALARAVGMSTSSFHKHFKQVTRTTPLQYQKDLRLTEARRLLRSKSHSVSTAAFAVGYQSPSQFSREFARKFGAPPQSQLQREAA